MASITLSMPRPSFSAAPLRIFLWTLGIGKHIRKNNCVLDSVGEILAQKQKNLFH
jgi:hypothetical protein